MKVRLVCASGLLALSLAGCGSGDDEPAPSPPDAGVPDDMTVTSPDIEEGGTVPLRFTCDGDNTSPALDWEGVPAEAKALALVVDDPDASSGTFTHWVVLDIPAGVDSAAEGAAPVGGVGASNSAGGDAYAGPCPPEGTHRYRFTVYALSAPTGLTQGTDVDDALAAIADDAISYGRLTATYASPVEDDS